MPPSLQIIISKTVTPNPGIVILSPAKDLIAVHTRRHARAATYHRATLASSALAISLATLLGCKPAPPPTPKTQQTPAPIRPTTAPPTFKLFHQTNDSFTLVTTPTATDDQISAIIWQLRDAAHTHTFDQLNIPQKLVDARDPMVWFHLYRGPKCAAEKYAPGAPPCGPSYHAAGDYTFGGGADHQWDDGVLLHDESHQTELWPPGSPYNAPPPAAPASQ
jgi:hypothetical protein